MAATKKVPPNIGVGIGEMQGDVARSAVIKVDLPIKRKARELGLLRLWRDVSIMTTRRNTDSGSSVLACQ